MGTDLVEIVRPVGKGPVCALDKTVPVKHCERDMVRLVGSVDQAPPWVWGFGREHWKLLPEMPGGRNTVDGRESRPIGGCARSGCDSGQIGERAITMAALVLSRFSVSRPNVKYCPATVVCRVFRVVEILATILLGIMLSHALAEARQHESHPVQNREPSTYVLAVGCCVPYLAPEPQVCSNAATGFVRLLAEKLRIPDKNLILLVNEEATYEKVTGALSRLSQVTGPEDTVIFYYNGHGVLLEDYEGDEEYGMDEVFALWSEEEPFSILYAVATGMWLVDDELGSLIRAIPSRKTVIVADTCHASETERGLYPRGAIVDYHQEKAALMSSARADQVSFFDVDNKMGLFTEELLRAVRAGCPDLKKAFLTARREVKKRWRGCARQIHMDEYSAGQTPTLTDPLNVTERISFFKDSKSSQRGRSHRPSSFRRTVMIREATMNNENGMRKGSPISPDTPESGLHAVSRIPAVEEIESGQERRRSGPVPEGRRDER